MVCMDFHCVLKCDVSFVAENCSTGEEYHITFKNCTACPLGMYRPEGARVSVLLLLDR